MDGRRPPGREPVVLRLEVCPCKPSGSIRAMGSVKLRNTRTQSHLHGAKARAKNVAGAYACRRQMAGQRAVQGCRGEEVCGNAQRNPAQAGRYLCQPDKPA